MAKDAFGAVEEFADGFSIDGYRIWADWDFRLEWQEGAMTKTTRVRVPPPWQERLLQLAAEAETTVPSLVREALQEKYDLPRVERYPIGKEGSEHWHALPLWVREARKAAKAKRTTGGKDS